MCHVTRSLIVLQLLIFALPIQQTSWLLRTLALNLQAPALPGLVTSIFIHADVFHLLGNMIPLFWIGTVVGKRLSRAQYVATYLASGVIGNLAQVAAFHYAELIGDAYLVGASGAISGLGGIALVLVPSTIRLYGDERPFPSIRRTISPLQWQVSFLVLLVGLLVQNLAMVSQLDSTSFSLLPVAVFAHLGGWGFGILWAVWVRFSPDGRLQYLKTRGERQFLRGQWWEALSLFEHAQSLAPADPEVARWLGRCYELSGQTQPCYKYFDEAIGLYEASGNRAGAAATRDERAKVVHIIPTLPRPNSSWE